MLDIIIAGIIGFFIGGFFGTLLMAFMVAARKGDDQ